MRSRSEFESFYESELKEVLVDLDHKRQAIKTKIITTVGVSLVGAAGAFFAAQHPAIPIIIVIAGIGITMLMCYGPSRQYRDQFKSMVIRPIVQFVNPELNYHPNDGLSQNTFRFSQIFQKGIDRYRSEDRVSGRSDKTEVDFSEVHAEYKTTTTDSKGRTQTRWHTIFQGVLFVADFNKHFHGQTFVLPDVAQSLFGSFGQTLQSWGKSHGELVKLENVEFEKEFVCYGSDQTEARYILSPTMMEKVLHLQRKAGRDIYLSFVDSKVFVAISFRRNLFEATLFSKLDQYSNILEYFDDLNFLLGIVEDLNLNTRIWTKE